MCRYISEHYNELLHLHPGEKRPLNGCENGSTSFLLAREYVAGPVYCKTYTYHAFILCLCCELGSAAAAEAQIPFLNAEFVSWHKENNHWLFSQGE